MQNVVLNNGVEMPILGFGVYQIPDAAECEKSVLTALEAGYRSIDTAAVNQIETHPFHQQIDIQAFLKENGVQQESWGPFAEGRNNLFSNELLAAIGKKYNKSIAQVVLRWMIQRNIVVIPKSVTKDRIVQ